MSLAIRSNICAEVTDKYTPQGLNMTDQFLKIFYSRDKVECSIYAKNDSIILMDGWCLMSLEIHHKYTRWLESLPPLMKELV
jgi:hypothetical protein